MVRDGALHRLADPPGRVGRELVAAAPVELLDGAVEAERALLDQVEERNAEAAVALGDRDDEPQVRLDHAPLGDQVARSIAFASVTSSAAVSSLWRPTSARKSCRLSPAPTTASGLADSLGRRPSRRRLLGGGCADLEPDAPRARAVSSSTSSSSSSCSSAKRLELGRLDEAALLGALDERRGPARSQAVREAGSASSVSSSVLLVLYSRVSTVRTVRSNSPGVTRGIRLS